MPVSVCRRLSLRVLFIGLIALGLSDSLPAEEPKTQGQDWPRFLGPHDTGVSDETNVLKTWPEGGPKILWSKRIGTGYSAPSIREDLLVLHHRIDDEEIIDGRDALTGEVVWTHKYPSSFEDPYGYNNGPRCSPLLTEDRCYTFGAEGMLTCVDLKTGKEIWRRDTKKDFNLPDWFFGIGCSPILEGDVLIALVGGQPNSGVVGFDAQTGKTLWENVGQKTWDGALTGERKGHTYKWTGKEQIVSYSSPIAATIHGQRHVLCLLRHGLVSLDPKDGSLRFKYWFRSRAYESVNAARPLVLGNRIFLTAAYNLGSVLLEVNRDNEVTEVWRDTENLLCHWSTPIEVNGSIYGFSGRNENEGELRCIDLKTGKVHWKTTGFDGDISDLSQDPRTGVITDKQTGKVLPWPFFGRGSKIRIGDRFLILGERGTLALAKINPNKYEELGRTSYKEIKFPAWTAPVLSRGLIYLRDEDALICLDARVKAREE
jgi:outer membrane protein assembly factor BamB